eukprot:2002664-Lingulodinium_polyedra.AAC.1
MKPYARLLNGSIRCTNMHLPASTLTHSALQRYCTRNHRISAAAARHLDFAPRPSSERLR